MQIADGVVRTDSQIVIEVRLPGDANQQVREAGNKGAIIFSLCCATRLVRKPAKHSLNLAGGFQEPARGRAASTSCPHLYLQAWPRTVFPSPDTLWESLERRWASASATGLFHS